MSLQDPDRAPILGPAGFALPTSTQAEWIGAIGVQLAPLVQARGLCVGLAGVKMTWPDG
jgi:hypothetical protein